jgi:hypothetical protein
VGTVSFAVITALLPTSAHSREWFEKVGTVGAQFLRVQPDPRGEALGGAYSALADGASSVHWNPAGLAFSSGIELADQGFIARKINWFAGMRLSFESASISLDALTDGLPLGTICLWRTRLEMAPTGVGEYSGEGTGYEFDAESEALGFSYARRVTQSLSVGFTYKRIEEKLADYEGRTNGFDLGAAFHETAASAEEVELGIGAAAGIRNLGSIKIGDHSTDLPREGYVGLAPTLRAVRLWDWLLETTVSGELVYNDPENRWVGMGGVEFMVLRGLSARYGGYKAEDSEREDSWGWGIAARYRHAAGLAFDYSKTDWGFMGEIKRYMLTIRLLNCDRGLDIESLIHAPLTAGRGGE